VKKVRDLIMYYTVKPALERCGYVWKKILLDVKERRFMEKAKLMVGGEGNLDPENISLVFMRDEVGNIAVFETIVELAEAANFYLTHKAEHMELLRSKVKSTSKEYRALGEKVYRSRDRLIALSKKVNEECTNASRFTLEEIVKADVNIQDLKFVNDGLLAQERQNLLTSSKRTPHGKTHLLLAPLYESIAQRETTEMVAAKEDWELLDKQIQQLKTFDEKIVLRSKAKIARSKYMFYVYKQLLSFADKSFDLTKNNAIDLRSQIKTQMKMESKRWQKDEAKLAIESLQDETERIYQMLRNVGR
jgi:hypothetical protein